MKWIFFLILLSSVVPLTAWLRQNPERPPIIWVVFGFLVIQHSPLHFFFAPISWATWPGYVKGVELSVLDFLAFALYLAQPRTSKSFPFKTVTIIYLLAILASALESRFAYPSLFFAWQTVRVFFIAFVVSRAAARDMHTTLALLRGMADGITVALGSAACEHLVHGSIHANARCA